MKILGIHAGHGCGVALIEDGRCTYAASEERFARKKVIFGFPRLAVADCLRYRGLSPGDIDHVALSTFNPVGCWSSFCKGRIDIFRQAGWRSLLLFDYPNEEKPFYWTGPSAVVLNLLAFTGVPTALSYVLTTRLGLRKVFGARTPVSLVGHHECHSLGAAYFSGMASPLSVVSEGYDGDASLKYDLFDGAWGSRRLTTTRMPHSAGSFYACPTFILGFNPHKHCGKITGLAAYGKNPATVAKVRKLMWQENGEIRNSPLIYLLNVEYARSKQLPSYFAGDSMEDIAGAFQQVLEEVHVDSFRAQPWNGPAGPFPLCLSGGVFANVKLNQRYLEMPEVGSVFVMPPMGDEGEPLGAAVCGLQKFAPAEWQPHRVPDMFLGPDFCEAEMEAALRGAGLTYRRSPCVEKEVAGLLHAGRVVARFNGRMEFGPRALGNRSILARPTDPAVNDWLNKRLKRTEFMPFAPSVLDRAVDRLFTGSYRKALGAAEFMTITFDCTEWMKKSCPAVVHVDGTARPQIVTPSSNPSYYRIIEEYEKVSGLPVVINTSYNMHEEPIVCTPQDAIRAFLQGHLDVLAMGPFIVENPAA